MSEIHAMHNLSYAHTKRVEHSQIRIGVLALQGAFFEHCVAIEKCGALAVEVRQAKDLENLHGLVLPGGESTVMAKLLVEEGLMPKLKELIATDIPVLATCAGLILLAKEIPSHKEQANLKVMDITALRNAFGRQQESFCTTLLIENLYDEVDNIDLANKAFEFEAIFIRAPQITNIENNVKILAKHEDKILAVKQNNIVACAFHPELSKDLLFHKWLVSKAK